MRSQLSDDQAVQPGSLFSIQIAAPNYSETPFFW